MAAFAAQVSRELVAVADGELTGELGMSDPPENGEVPIIASLKSDTTKGGPGPRESLAGGRGRASREKSRRF